MDAYLASLPRWVEVDLDAVAHNLEEMKKTITPGVKIAAVVKADAYGHGAARVAKTVLAGGADMLAVTFVEEGISLRKEGITAPILVFAPILLEQVPDIVSYDLTPSISTSDVVGILAREAGESGRRVAVHVKVETGMGRTGLLPSEVPAVVQEILTRPELKLEGIYSHFASALSGDREFTERQFRLFQQVMEELRQTGVEIPLAHVCNSAAAIRYPHMHLNMVRLGTILYGQYPGGNMIGNLQIKDTWKLKARILFVKKHAAGTAIGYGRTYRTKKDTWIAVLPVGFVDGFTMEPHLKPTGFIDFLKILIKITAGFLGLRTGPTAVEIEGRFVPVVGKAAMQLSMVDLGELGANCASGTAAVIPVRRTGINPLIPKLYLAGGQPVALRTVSGGELELDELREFMPN